jgi:hypothetical protein
LGPCAAAAATIIAAIDTAGTIRATTLFHLTIEITSTHVLLEQIWTIGNRRRHRAL